MASCPECGAEVPEGGTCRENLHALLALEWTIPGVPEGVAHFYAVSTYGLQHPDSMNYIQETLTHFLGAVVDLLEERATLDDIRLRIRRVANGVRVTRREGDPIPVWHRGKWEMTVTDVLSVEAEKSAYLERVTAWARSVCETLAADVSKV